MSDMFASFPNPLDMMSSTTTATATATAADDKPKKKKTYDTALRAYLLRHPDTTDEDIDIIKKEGGDLQTLFLWGASEEDIEDAEIIARGPGGGNDGSSSSSRDLPPPSSSSSAPAPAPAPAGPCATCASLKAQLAAVVGAPCGRCAAAGVELHVLQQRLDDAIEARVGSEYDAERVKLRAEGDRQELERLRKAHAELQERATKLAQAQDTSSSSAAAEALRLRQELDALEQRHLAAVQQAAQADLRTREVEQRLKEAQQALAAATSGAAGADADAQQRLAAAQRQAADALARAQTAEDRLSQAERAAKQAAAETQDRLSQAERAAKQAAADWQDRLAAAEAQTRAARDDADRLNRLLKEKDALAGNAATAVAKELADTKAQLAGLRDENARLKQQVADATDKAAAEQKQAATHAAGLQKQLDTALAQLAAAQSQPAPPPPAPPAPPAAPAPCAECAMLRVRVAELEAQGKADAATIADLRKQLKELMQKKTADDEMEKKRVADLREVNDTLLRMARERAFQNDLKQRYVQVALAAWGGDASKYSEADLDAARYDDTVKRIFPRMKEFEKVCDAAKIKFPVDHIMAGKTELSKEAVTYAFGPDFVAKHHLTGHYKNP